MTDVAQAMEALRSKFNPGAAGRLDLVFGFRIDGTQNFSLTVENGTCELGRGVNPHAKVTLVMDADTLKGIADGSTDSTRAFMAGKVRAEGDALLAAKVSELFSA